MAGSFLLLMGDVESCEPPYFGSGAQSPAGLRLTSPNTSKSTSLTVLSLFADADDSATAGR